MFDNRGNLLSWQRKPGAGKQETGQRLRRYCQDEQAKGNERKEQLLAYIRDRVSSGALGLQDSNQPGEVGEQPLMTVSRGADGTVQFVTTPHLRHRDEA